MNLSSREIENLKKIRDAETKRLLDLGCNIWSVCATGTNQTKAGLSILAMNGFRINSNTENENIGEYTKKIMAEHPGYQIAEISVMLVDPFWVDRGGESK